MYHTGKNPLRKVSATSEEVSVVRSGRHRRVHKAFLRYHDPENWPLLREALQRMGRADLIGNGKKHLIPTFQPAGTGNVLQRAGGGQPKSRIAPVRRFAAPAKPGSRLKLARRP
jgi:hypothetical protein